MKLLFIFTVLTIVNVIFSTIKSIVTIKSGKTVASLISALYYGYYNIVLIYTVADFPLWQKVAVTFFCNLVGVWLVKWGEEKVRKDKLWLVKITIPVNYSNIIKKELNNNNISFTYYDINKYFVFDCFCENQKDTKIVSMLCKKYQGKIFATENKIL
jgi:hypothetical protein